MLFSLINTWARLALVWLSFSCFHPLLQFSQWIDGVEWPRFHRPTLLVHTHSHLVLSTYHSCTVYTALVGRVALLGLADDISGCICMNCVVWCGRNDNYGVPKPTLPIKPAPLLPSSFGWEKIHQIWPIFAKVVISA